MSLLYLDLFICPDRTREVSGSEADLLTSMAISVSAPPAPLPAGWRGEMQTYCACTGLASLEGTPEYWSQIGADGTAAPFPQTQMGKSFCSGPGRCSLGKNRRVSRSITLWNVNTCLQERENCPSLQRSLFLTSYFWRPSSKLSPLCSESLGCVEMKMKMVAVSQRSYCLYLYQFLRKSAMDWGEAVKLSRVPDEGDEESQNHRKSAMRQSSVFVRKDFVNTLTGSGSWYLKRTEYGLCSGDSQEGTIWAVPEGKGEDRRWRGCSMEATRCCVSLCVVQRDSFFGERNLQYRLNNNHETLM